MGIESISDMFVACLMGAAEGIFIRLLVGMLGSISRKKGIYWRLYWGLNAGFTVFAVMALLPFFIRYAFSSHFEAICAAVLFTMGFFYYGPTIIQNSLKGDLLFHER